MTAPRLDTDRLTLRGFRAADLDPLARFFSDEKATAFIGGPRVRSSAHSILSRFAGEWVLYGFGQWAIEEKSTGMLAGFTGWINHSDWPEPELGWTVFPAFQGRGYATEAARAARAEIVRRGGPSRIASYVNDENLPSVKVAEKLGAAPEGEVTLRGERVRVWRHPATIDGGRA